MHDHWDSLSPVAFRDALAKGLGRALIHAKRCMNDALLEPIKEALTRNFGYDPQCEGSRYDYLLELTDAAGGLHRFRETIIAALPRTEQYWDASQLFTLCGYFAQRGDEDVRAAMYSAFRNGIHRTHHWPGAFDLIELDGRAGLQAVARALGERLLHEPSYPADDIRWFSNESIGEGDIERALAELSKSDPHVRRYLDHLCRLKSPLRPHRLTNEELQSVSIDEVLSLDVNADTIRGPYAFRRWGRVAGYSELLEAANRIKSETDLATLRLLLGCFREREFPANPSALLGIFDRFPGDQRMCRAAECALQQCESDDVRAAALDLIQNRRNVCRGLALLCSNYEQGDWSMLHEALQSAPLDRDGLHDAGFWLLDMFDDEMTHEEPGAMLWMYENTPCANCRGSAFELLRDAERVPLSMVYEMLADCKPKNREMAADVLGK